MALTKVEQSKRLKRNEEKWSSVLMEAGWTVLPSIILEKQHALGLDPIDVNILLQLARHWWYSDNPPHPSKATIARCLGIDPSTVRRHVARMEADGFIRREARYSPKFGGQETNIYHFDGLIKAATPHAREFIVVRDQRRREDAVRRTRKKPRLMVVSDAKREEVAKE
jgi:DNA-binding Lrp family transcriptional regulator